MHQIIAGAAGFGMKVFGALGLAANHPSLSAIGSDEGSFTSILSLSHIFAFYLLTSFDHQSWQFSPCISFANHGHEKGKHTRVKRSILPVADSMIILNKLPWEMRWIGIPCWNWKSQIVVFNGFLLVFPCYSDWRKAECIIGLDHASGKMVRQNTLRMYCWIMLLLHEECVRC